MARARLYKSRLLVLLLVIGCLGIYLFYGDADNNNNLMDLSSEELKILEPNQTRWLELLKMPSEMINLTTPRISSKAKMIVIVILQPHYEERRAEIRDSWAYAKNSQAIQNGHVSVIFVVSSDNYFQQRLIKEEHEKYGDILLVRGKDTYKGLVYKLLLAYKWITKHYPTADVVKVDSDVVVDIDRLYQAVNKQAHNNQFIMGYLLKNVKPHRQPYDPWYIPSSSYSGKYLPLYVNGPFYIFSSSALKSVLLEAPHRRLFEMEDALFTGILAESAKIKRIPHQGILNKRPKKQLCIDGKPTIIAYPIHDTKISMRLEYVMMKNIPCMTYLEGVFSSIF